MSHPTDRSYPVDPTASAAAIRAAFAALARLPVVVEPHHTPGGGMLPAIRVDVTGQPGARHTVLSALAALADVSEETWTGVSGWRYHDRTGSLLGLRVRLQELLEDAAEPAPVTITEPACRRAAIVRVEVYHPVGARGVLDRAVYVCEEHTNPTVERLRAAGRSVYRAAAYRLPDGRPCGHVFDYAATADEPDGGVR